MDGGGEQMEWKVKAKLGLMKLRAKRHALQANYFSDNADDSARSHNDDTRSTTSVDVSDASNAAADNHRFTSESPQYCRP